MRRLSPDPEPIRRCEHCGAEIPWGEGFYDFEPGEICGDCMVEYVVQHYYTH